jgi:hypothetical protein
LATLPTNASRKEKRAVVRFLWAKGFSASAIRAEMRPVYGDKSFARSVIERWLQKVQEAVRGWLAKQSPTFFSTGIQKLVSRWDKCLNVHGGYVEK